MSAEKLGVAELGKQPALYAEQAQLGKRFQISFRNMPIAALVSLKDLERLEAADRATERMGYPYE